MQHTDAIQIINGINNQSKLLERIATAFERTNELLWALLSPDQKKTIQNTDAHRLAKRTSIV